MKPRAAPLVLLVIASVTVAAHQATFSARVDTVRVDVLVSDGRQPILGLTPDDFQVLDMGVPQKVDLVTFEQIPLDVVLALDMSGSVTGGDHTAPAADISQPRAGAIP